MEDRMMALCEGFTRGTELFYDGMMIGKVKYEQLLGGRSEGYKSEIVKNNGKLCVVACKGYKGEEVAECLTVYLMSGGNIREGQHGGRNEGENCIEVADNKANHNMGDKVASKCEDNGNCVEEEVWRCFGKEDVYRFSKMTGDRNSIHLTGKPIVQGLFILKELCKQLAAQEIEVRYLEPIYGEDEVYLEVKENSFQGMSRGKLCFKGKYMNKEI